MPAAINVNNRTVVHATSGGIFTGFPDVCKTPTPGGPVPIPYPNIAKSQDTAMGSATVTMDGNPIMLKGSCFALSTGDEAGSVGGMVSSVIKGKAEFDRFKIWCWLSPQPPKPADPADDTKDATKKYRNRNIRYKHVKGAPSGKVKASEPSDTSPLYFATTTKTPGGGDVVDVAAKEGWYINISEVVEANKLARIPRHKNWDKDPKAWEWWHYQCPPHTLTGSSSALSFGECLQLYGVHEYRLRQLANGWSTHEDIEHAPG